MTHIPPITCIMSLGYLLRGLKRIFYSFRSLNANRKNQALGLIQAAALWKEKYMCSGVEMWMMSSVISGCGTLKPEYGKKFHSKKILLGLRYI